MFLGGVASKNNLGLVPQPGGIALVGRVPSLELNNLITPPAAAFSLGGVAPGVSYTDHRIVEPLAGGLSLVGIGVSYDSFGERLITPVAGGISLAGVGPLVGITIISPVVPINTGISPMAGQVAIDGVSLANDTGIAPSSGALIFVPAAKHAGYLRRIMSHKFIPPFVGGA